MLNSNFFLVFRVFIHLSFFFILLFCFIASSYSDNTQQNQKILNPFLINKEESPQENSPSPNPSPSVSPSVTTKILPPSPFKDNRQSSKVTDLQNQKLLKLLKKKLNKSHFKIKNILILSLNSLAPILALDKNLDRIVGIHPFIKNFAKSKFYEKYFPALFKIPSYISSGKQGQFPHIQSILQLKPNLIIYSDSILETKEFLNLKNQTQTQKERLIFKLNPKTEKDFIQLLQSLSSYLNQEKFFDSILKHRDQVKDYLLKKLEMLPKYQKPRVLILNWIDNGYQIAPHGHFDQFSLNLSGAQSLLNSKDFGGYFVEKEWIIKNQPDFIFLYSYDNSFLHPDMIYQDFDFKSIPAVIKKQVYVIPFAMNFWNSLDIEAPLYWLWLAKLLHPNHMKNFDFIRFLKKSYALWIQQNIRSLDILDILAWKQNQVSSHYHLFHK